MSAEAFISVHSVDQVAPTEHADHAAVHRKHVVIGSFCFAAHVCAYGISAPCRAPCRAMTSAASAAQQPSSLTAVRRPCLALLSKPRVLSFVHARAVIIRKYHTAGWTRVGMGEILTSYQLLPGWLSSSPITSRQIIVTAKSIPSTTPGRSAPAPGYMARRECSMATSRVGPWRVMYLAVASGSWLLASPCSKACRG